MLDLMALCWSQQPMDRPSASQVVSISSAPEFTHLCDAVSLEHADTVVGTASTPLLQAGEDSVVGAWLARGGSSATVDLLLASPCSWLQHYSLATPRALTAACQVGGLGAVWLGDAAGQIHAYSASDCSHLFSYLLDPEQGQGQEAAGVCCLLPLPPLARVAVGLDNGRLFLVRSDTLPAAPTMAEGSFVMAELGSSSALFSLAAVFREAPAGGALCELWCGGARGNISVYTIHDNVVTGHDVVEQHESVAADVEVRQLVAAPECGADEHAFVWSFVYPGSVVYQWDVETKTLVNKLDCSKLVPCSESLKSISIEEHLSPGRCQVTALAVQDGELYIGTTWGCVVVAERATLRPVTVFRPFEEEVHAIVPLAGYGTPRGTLSSLASRSDSALSETSSSSSSPAPSPASRPDQGGGKSSGQGRHPLVATVGRGYRSLIHRYTDSIPNSQGQSQGRSNTCTLLWRAEHWAVR